VTKTIREILAGAGGGAGGVCRQRAKDPAGPGGAQRGRRARRRSAHQDDPIPMPGATTTLGRAARAPGSSSTRRAHRDDRLHRHRGRFDRDHHAGRTERSRRRSSDTITRADSDCCALACRWASSPCHGTGRRRWRRASRPWCFPRGRARSGEPCLVVSKRKFAASWEYLLGHCDFHFAADPSNWAGAALVSPKESWSAWVRFFGARRRREVPGPWKHVRAYRSAQAHPLRLIEKGRRSGPAVPGWVLRPRAARSPAGDARVSGRTRRQGGIRNGDIVVAWAPDLR